MPNIYAPTFEEDERPPGFRARRARIGYELGTEHLGCSLWELPPGEAAYPYHYHYADEELIIVVRGRPTLRTPAGTGAHSLLLREFFRREDGVDYWDREPGASES